MSYRYKVVKKTDNIHPEKPTAYYLQSKSVSSVEFNDLLEDMVLHVSLTRSEASAALEYLFESVEKFLKMGMCVKIWDYGYIRTTIRSEKCESPEKATSAKVKEVGLNFVFSKKFKNRMNKNATFLKIRPKAQEPKKG